MPSGVAPYYRVHLASAIDLQPPHILSELLLILARLCLSFFSFAELNYDSSAPVDQSVILEAGVAGSMSFPFPDFMSHIQGGRYFRQEI